MGGLGVKLVRCSYGQIAVPLGIPCRVLPLSLFVSENDGKVPESTHKVAKVPGATSREGKV